MPERIPGDASERLDGLLRTFAALPEPGIEEFRETVAAMGIDPDEAVARVRELMRARAAGAPVLGHRPSPARAVAASRRWVDRRFVKVGTCAGTLAGICCLGKAVTVSAGLAVSTVFGTLVDKYQVYFFLGGLGLLVLWLVWMLRPQWATVAGLGAALRGAARPAAVSFGTYFVTLGLTMGAMVFADWLWPRP